MLITTMCFEVLLGMGRMTRWDCYNEVDAPGRDNKEGMHQAAEDEMDMPGLR